MRNLLSLTFLMLMISSSIKGQSYSKIECKEDLIFLKDQMKSNIPSLNEYVPDFEESAIKIIDSINDSISDFDYFGLLSQLASLGDEGHILITDWDSDLLKGFSDNRYKYLPLKIRVIDDRLFVEDIYYPNDHFNIGDEILGINGARSSEIIDQLLKYIPSDGDIYSYGRMKISDNFNWYYYLYIDRSDSAEFFVDIHEKNERRKFYLNAVTLKSMRDYIASTAESVQKVDSVESEVYEFTLLEDYAVLKLKSYDWSLLDNENIKSKQLYKDIFQRLQYLDVENLVIDIRGNTGGRNEFADDLIPYINTKNKRGLLKESISCTGKVKKYKIPSTSKLIFTGNIVVIVDGKTYSAGASTARYLKEYSDAIFVGEEAGTRYEGFAGGSYNSIVLPNSDFRISLPRYHIKYPSSVRQNTMNRGLIPDFQISQSFNDILNGHDLHMKKALELLELN